MTITIAAEIKCNKSSNKPPKNARGKDTKEINPNIAKIHSNATVASPSEAAANASNKKPTTAQIPTKPAIGKNKESEFSNNSLISNLLRKIKAITPRYNIDLNIYLDISAILSKFFSIFFIS